MYYLCIYYHVNKRDYILMGEIWWNFGGVLSYVLSTLEGSSDTFGHYFSDIIYTSAVRYFPDKGSVFGVVAGSALIAAGASGVFTYLLPALFPAYYKEQNWDIG